MPPGDKTEIRFRGPNVMPGYWRAPEQTAEAFDDEGFYRTGDAVNFVDPADPQRGLMFDGRIAEDFKLSTGTFVSVGPLRAKVIAHGAPLVQDVGGRRPQPRRHRPAGVPAPRRMPQAWRPAGDDADAPHVLAHPAVRAFFQDLVDRLWRAGTGSANRVARAHLLVEPPSIDTRRGHRQGLDQPARRAEAPRRARRRALRRQ